MAISEAAQRNHDELFPGHVSTLAVTDPELIEFFDNFAFDEVLQHGDLDTRTRLMVQLAAMIAVPGAGASTGSCSAPRSPSGVTPVEVKEIVYQAVPYVGMAKVFDFLHATNDVLTERGVELPLPGQSTTTPPRPALEQGPGGAEADRRRRAGRRDVRRRARRRAAHPAVPVGELLRRPLHPRRHRHPAPASCSPSPCSSPSAAANRKWPDTSRRTSTSATTAPCCSTC